MSGTGGRRAKGRAIGQCLAMLAALVFAATPAQAQSPIRDAEIEQFIRDLSRPIFIAAGIPPDSVQILLLADKTINAFATASGGLLMGVHTGLITQADTPNQIAGVIAHEAGHFTGGHIIRGQDAYSAATAPMLVTLLLGAAAIAAGAPEAGIAVIGGGQQLALGQLLRYSRIQESAADQAGLTFLEAAGQSPYGLLEFFDTLRVGQVLLSSDIPSYATTHPLAAERLTILQRRAAESPYRDVKDPPEMVLRLKLAQAKIYGFLHPPETTLRIYPESDQSLPARYARAIAYYQSAAITVDRALAEIDSIIAEHPDNPYFHELKGQILFEHGRAGESVGPHERAVELAPNQPLLALNLGRSLLATERPEDTERAIAVLKNVVRIEPRDGFAWSQLAIGYGRQQDEGRALLATAESRYAYGDVISAHSFARRAQAELERNTPEYRQAVDIIASTAAKVEDARSQQRRRRNVSPLN